MKMKQYAHLVIGSFIVALCFNLLLSPNQIASGGLPGASILLSELFAAETPHVLLLLTIGLLVIGGFFLEKDALAKSVFCSLLIPLFVYMTKGVTPLTQDPLLAAIYSGIGLGIGLGMVFRANGNVGGFTLIAQILHKYYAVKPSSTLTVLDGSVIVCAGMIFSPEIALYALLGLFLMRKTMDVVLGNTKASKVAYIISSVAYEEKINEAVLYELDRGLTNISAVGGYSKDERAIMMTVLPSIKAAKLKATIQAIDANAFIIFCDATEVVGEGFSQPVSARPFQKLVPSRA